MMNVFFILLGNCSFPTSAEHAKLYALRHDQPFLSSGEGTSKDFSFYCSQHLLYVQSFQLNCKFNHKNMLSLTSVDI